MSSMKVSQEVDVYCPAKYAYGGEFKYSHFGSDRIDPNTDLIYHFEVIDCQDSVKDLKYSLKKKGLKVPKFFKVKDSDRIIGSAIRDAKENFKMVSKAEK